MHAPFRPFKTKLISTVILIGGEAGIAQVEATKRAAMAQAGRQPNASSNCSLNGSLDGGGRRRKKIRIFLGNEAMTCKEKKKNPFENCYLPPVQTPHPEADGEYAGRLLLRSR